MLGDELWSLGRITKLFTAKPIFPGPMFFLYFFFFCKDILLLFLIVCMHVCL